MEWFVSENKIENTDKKTTSENGGDDKPENEEIDAVVGGCVGRNWHKEYNDTLFRLSVAHENIYLSHQKLTQIAL